jgi:hypothetical protein
MKIEHLDFIFKAGFKTIERVDMGHVYLSNGDYLLMTDDECRSISIHSEKTGKCLVILRDFRYGGKEDLTNFISK